MWIRRTKEWIWKKLLRVGDLRYKYQEETNKVKLDIGKEKMILVNVNEFETLRRVEIEAKVKNIDEQNNFLRK